ncbi:MAG TPA: ATP-binding cassette domain-containing protein [Thermohalobaculum sp.]|nr:ATP-binding cassette domain-containing protein [Thermohalobaculum sp.]
MTGLEAQGIVKRYGGLTVADRVDLALPPGRRVALIGPNGAGKTTLADILTGITAPSAGRVLLDGADITALDEARRVRAGIAKTFQITALFPGLSLRDNLRLALIERRRESWRPFARVGENPEVEAEAAALLADFDLTGAADRRTGDLPYGAQRLADIALALALRPRVLILDEPSAGVPAGERARLLDVLAALPSDLAVLIIEHDMDLVFRLAERIVVLVEGAVLAEGPPEAIAADARVRELYLGARHG